jgi:hypothetical protein
MGTHEEMDVDVSVDDGTYLAEEQEDDGTGG